MKLGEVSEDEADPEPGKAEQGGFEEKRNRRDHCFFRRRSAK